MSAVPTSPSSVVLESLLIDLDTISSRIRHMMSCNKDHSVLSPSSKYLDDNLVEQGDEYGEVPEDDAGYKKMMPLRTTSVLDSPKSSLLQYSFKSNHETDLDSAVANQYFRQSAGHHGPIGSGFKLRDYQRGGIQWLLSLRSQGLNGILADEMGLGKTMQTIGFFCYLHKLHNITGPHLIVMPLSVIESWKNDIDSFCNPDTIRVHIHCGEKQERYDSFKAWNKSIKQKHTTWKSCSHLIEIVLTTYDMVIRDHNLFQKFKRNGNNSSYGISRSSFSGNNSEALSWEYLIVDEAQRLKNKKCVLLRLLDGLQTSNRLLLSGTPFQNNTTELWTLLGFVLPQVVEGLSGYREWFDSSFLYVNKSSSKNKSIGRNNNSNSSSGNVFASEPFGSEKDLSTSFEFIDVEGDIAGMDAGIDTDMDADRSSPSSFHIESCEDGDDMEVADTMTIAVTENFSNSNNVSELQPNENDEVKVLNALHRILAPVLLRRLKSDVLIDIPPKYEKIIMCPATSLQKKLYHHFKDYVATLRKGFFGRRGSPTSFDFFEVENSIPELDGNSSGVGSNAFSRSHTKNIVMQLRKLCNHPYLLLEDMQHIPDDLYFDQLVSSCGKLKVLDTIIKNLLAGSHKIVIFSQMTSMLNIIQGYLEKNGILSYRLDGSTPRQERVKQTSSFGKDDVFAERGAGDEHFNGDESDVEMRPKQVFLMSTRAGGVGLNLQSADTVILYDMDWNPQSDIQAMARTHRIGQTKKVLILRLVTVGNADLSHAAGDEFYSIEERIVSKSEIKRLTEKNIFADGKFVMGTASASTSSSANNNNNSSSSSSSSKNDHMSSTPPSSNNIYSYDSSITTDTDSQRFTRSLRSNSYRSPVSVAVEHSSEHSPPSSALDLLLFDSIENEKIDFKNCKNVFLSSGIEVDLMTSDGIANICSRSDDNSNCNSNSSNITYSNSNSNSSMNRVPVYYIRDNSSKEDALSSSVELLNQWEPWFKDGVFLPTIAATSSAAAASYNSNNKSSHVVQMRDLVSTAKAKAIEGKGGLENSTSFDASDGEDDDDSEEDGEEEEDEESRTRSLKPKSRRMRNSSYTFHNFDKKNKAKKYKVDAVGAVDADIAAVANDNITLKRKRSDPTALLNGQKLKFDAKVYHREYYLKHKKMKLSNEKGISSTGSTISSSSSIASPVSSRSKKLGIMSSADAKAIQKRRGRPPKKTINHSSSSTSNSNSNSTRNSNNNRSRSNSLTSSMSDDDSLDVSDICQVCNQAWVTRDQIDILVTLNSNIASLGPKCCGNTSSSSSSSGGGGGGGDNDETLLLSCVACSKEFRSMAGLLYHEQNNVCRSKTDDEAMYTCSTCKKGFKSLGGLQYHEEKKVCMQFDRRGSHSNYSATSMIKNSTSRKDKAYFEALKETMVICDSCDRSFHVLCLGMSAVPDGEEWHCIWCLQTLEE